MEKATRQHTKEHNRNLVLKHIFQHESISRADIARTTRLTATTVSDIVADLIEEGLVSETGVGHSIGGKNPILLNLLEDAKWLIGLDLAHNQFRGAVVNLRGKIHKVITLPVNDCTGDEALALVYEILDQLIEGISQPLLGIGVGAPGLINTTEGMIVNSVNLNWVNLPLTYLLKKRYHLPVYILNDSQAAAIGEYTFGKEHQADEDLIVINVRHGIGAGIVINGDLFQGDGGSAGEIGHIIVVPEGGALCRCGKKGCLETVASAQALIKRVRSLLSQYPNSQLAQNPQAINLESIEKAFINNDPLACQTVLETAHFIGLAISSLVGILNIQKIFLAGDMTRFGEPWLAEIKNTMMNSCLAEAAQATRVEIGQLSENGIILGTSAIMVNNYSLLFNH
jgi:N-acetylglucosamine repressor